MKIRFKEMQGRMADDGKPSSTAAIASMLSINKRTITNIVTGNEEGCAHAIGVMLRRAGATPADSMRLVPFEWCAQGIVDKLVRQ